MLGQEQGHGLNAAAYWLQAYTACVAFPVPEICFA